MLELPIGLVNNYSGVQSPLKIKLLFPYCDGKSDFNTAG